MEEVHKLQEVEFMVMVKKANGKWGMYVDFTDLNKACPRRMPKPMSKLMTSIVVFIRITITTHLNATT